MKQNYIDGKGVYHNELNLTLAQIYDSGVEFGCKVTAKDKAEDIIAELEKIKAEIETTKCKVGCLPRIIAECNISKSNREWCEYYYCLKIINEHIAELKGE